jgi:hypothetical protein
MQQRHLRGLVALALCSVVLGALLAAVPATARRVNLLHVTDRTRHNSISAKSNLFLLLNPE